MRRPRGAVNLVSLTLLVAAVSGAYLAWIYVPLWLDDLDVRETLAAAAGQLVDTAAISPDQNNIRQIVAGKLKKVGTHWEDQDGKNVELPGLGVAPEDVQIEASPDGRSARVTLDYARTVKLRPLERYWTIQFHTAREGSIR